MKIITSKPECVWKLKNLLGEGTLWVKSLNSIFFVDIKKRKIFILNTKNNKKKIIKVNKEIGFLSHIRKNIFILGLKGELRIVNLKTKKNVSFIRPIKTIMKMLNVSFIHIRGHTKKQDKHSLGNERADGLATRCL